MLQLQANRSVICADFLQGIWWCLINSSVGKESPLMQETHFDSWIGKICWRRDRLPTLASWPGEFHGLYSPRGHKESDMTERLSFNFTSIKPQGFPGVSEVKNLPASAGDSVDTGLIPGLGRSPAEGNGNPLQDSCLENPMDRGPSWLQGVTKSWTQLSIRIHTHIKALNVLIVFEIRTLPAFYPKEIIRESGRTFYMSEHPIQYL